MERIAAHRASDDETVNAVWAAPATLAAIGRYVDSLKPRADGATQRS
jgi:hypothetical protein